MITGVAYILSQIYRNIVIIVVDTSCERCYTSYYCLGDSEAHMCGRCENDTITCDRSPTEHSFGAASECVTCPKGWVSVEISIRNVTICTILYSRKFCNLHSHSKYNIAYNHRLLFYFKVKIERISKFCLCSFTLIFSSRMKLMN